MIQLVSQILQVSNENEHTIGVSIDLNKAFDTVDHIILPRKIELYGIKNNNLSGFKVTCQIGYSL